MNPRPTLHDLWWVTCCLAQGLYEWATNKPAYTMSTLPTDNTQGNTP